MSFADSYTLAARMTLGELPLAELATRCREETLRFRRWEPREDAPEALTGREAPLLSGVGTATSALLADLGNLEFADVPSGSYLLEVDPANRVIVIEELHVD